MQTGNFNLSASAKIYYDKACKNEAVFLQQLLMNEHNLKIQVSEKNFKHLPPGDIYLTTFYLDTDSMANEEYRLKIDQRNIIITGAANGIFYGIQSLRQIIKDQGNTKLTVPCLGINDRPRFTWRAFLLDEGRQFKGAKV